MLQWCLRRVGNIKWEETNKQGIGVKARTEKKRILRLQFGELHETERD
jgi:hypothetical protein